MTVSECCILVHMHAQALTHTSMHVHTHTRMHQIQVHVLLIHVAMNSNCLRERCPNALRNELVKGNTGILKWIPLQSNGCLAVEVIAL